MSELIEIIERLRKFRDDRDWSQFHDSKNLALAISIEAAELNELFLWKNQQESEAVSKKRISEELADVFLYAMLLADKHELDIIQILSDKIKQNEIKYPADKARGNARKYDEL